MRVLVCGGRTFKNRRLVYEALDILHRVGIDCIIEGGASGADMLGRQWAHSAAVPIETFYADWDMYGPGAGPMRNARMLAEGKPDIVLAFPGGPGTADMVRRAKAAGIYVERVTPTPHQQTEEG
jgi:YspA, cpYpsA-related SLOG family